MQNNKVKTPEEKARERIDEMFGEAGWKVLSRDEYTPNISAVALEEGLMNGNLEADYLLFISGKAVGVLEAKRVEIDVDTPLWKIKQSNTRKHCLIGISIGRSLYLWHMYQMANSFFLRIIGYLTQTSSQLVGSTRQKRSWRCYKFQTFMLDFLPLKRKACVIVSMKP